MAGNIAHSINGIKSGHGLYTIDRGGDQTCMEVPKFIGYKCWHMAAFALSGGPKIYMHDIISIDNRLGFSAATANGGTEYL